MREAPPGDRGTIPRPARQLSAGPLRPAGADQRLAGEGDPYAASMVPAAEDVGITRALSAIYQGGVNVHGGHSSVDSVPSFVNMDNSVPF